MFKNRIRNTNKNNEINSITFPTSNNFIFKSLENHVDFVCLASLCCDNFVAAATCLFYYRNYHKLEFLFHFFMISDFIVSIFILIKLNQEFWLF